MDFIIELVLLLSVSIGILLIIQYVVWQYKTFERVVKSDYKIGDTVYYFSNSYTYKSQYNPYYEAELRKGEIKEIVWRKYYDKGISCVGYVVEDSETFERDEMSELDIVCLDLGDDILRHALDERGINYKDLL